MFSENFGVAKEEASVATNFEPDRALFRKFNLTATKECSANKIYRNILGNTVAILCNCGKKHQVIGNLVFWSTEIDSVTLATLKMNKSNLLKAVWVNED